jgi:Polyketide cyclase / dehydrase and lipid transport
MRGFSKDRRRMRARHWIFLFSTIAPLTQWSAAATLGGVEVTREGERYHLVAQAHMDATAATVYAVLVDYDDDHFGQISDIHKESDYLGADGDGTPLVYTRVEGCLLFYCRSMRRVERLESVEPSFIRTTALPDRSDFKYARSEWALTEDGSATSITYQLTIEPDFWLPPFVGPWFLQRTLSRGGVNAIERIEELAKPTTSKLGYSSSR